jgi:hypothetical protein
MNQLNNEDAIAPLVIEDYLNTAENQVKKGLEKYGVILRTWNDNDPFDYAMEELVDLSMYLKQLKMQYEGTVKAFNDTVAIMTNISLRLDDAMISDEKIDALLDDFWNMFHKLPTKLKYGAMKNET